MTDISNFNYEPRESYDSLDSLAHHLWQQETLPDILRRGLFMRDFRIVPCGDMMQVSFGGESHMYPKPDNAAIERIVAAFAPEQTPPDMPLPLRVDEAAHDG